MQLRQYLTPVHFWLAAILSLLVTTNVTAQDEELLAPEEAFAFSAQLNGNVIDAKWLIADGYYMYADKFSFSVEDSQAALEAFSWPKGKSKNDPLFGEVEIYEDKVQVQLPLSSAVQQITLNVRGQGCNEPVGVCYPPIGHSLQLVAGIAATGILDNPAGLDIGAGNEGSSLDSELGSLSELRDLLGAQAAESEFLPVEQAFDLLVTPESENQLLGNFYITDGYYLYQDKIKFSVAGMPAAELQFPAGKTKQDDYFGEVVVHQKDFALPILLANAKGGKLTIDAEYQGCAEQGICYPPVQKSFTLSMPSLIQSVQASHSSDNISANTDSTAPPVASKSIWLLLLGAFVAGIGLTFTPCVLPLIPILSSVIAGQGEQLSKAKAAWLAVIYVLGTAVTYALIGAFAGATGDQLQAYFQNAWAIGVMAAIVVLMALSMFGLFEIQMPSFIQSRMQEKSQSIKGGSTPTAFVLGLLSALIVGACVSPILISFLGIAIAKGSASLGAITMFAMALGMGIPLVLLALGAGHWLPKAGKWMDSVKYAFGVMLLGVAIYLLGALPQVPVLLLWAALFIVVAIYCGATQSLAEGAGGWFKLVKGLGTLLLIWGALALVGGLYGQRDILKPLPKNLFSAQSIETLNSDASVGHYFKRVNNESELDAQLALAQSQGKFVLIDYYADWCVDCLRMEKTTFADVRVRKELDARFIALQVDVTDPNDADKKVLKQRYGVYGPPAMLFINPQGEQLKDKSFYGYKDAEAFLSYINVL